MRTTGQAPIALALCEGVTRNKTGGHPLTHWRGRPARHHGLWCAKHHVRAHGHHPPLGAFLHDSRLPEAWERRPAYRVVRAGTMPRTSSARRACLWATAHWSTMGCDHPSPVRLARAAHPPWRGRVCRSRKPPRGATRTHMPSIPRLSRGHARERGSRQRRFFGRHATPPLVALAGGDVEVGP